MAEKVQAFREISDYQPAVITTVYTQKTDVNTNEIMTRITNATADFKLFENAQIPQITRKDRAWKYPTDNDITFNKVNLCESPENQHSNPGATVAVLNVAEKQNILKAL